MEKIRILLADDHEMVRTGLIKLLESYTMLQIVGEAEDGEQTLEQVKKLKPDVVVIDLSMPRMSGIEATKRIREEFPKTNVLVLTMHENEEYVYQIFKSGAGGYLLKNTGKEELASAIQAVARGEQFISPRVSDIMVQAYVRKAQQREGRKTEDLPLTSREQEVLSCIAEGLSNQQIAQKLFISPRTVDTHRTNIMQKLDVHDAAGLMKIAMEQKFSKK